MALVVFLRGVNVGGHRTFRPVKLAEELRHLDAVNIGAAGTLVIRRPVPKARLRAELVRRLPFEAEIMIRDGREIARLLSEDPFAGRPVRRDVVRFVSVLSKRPRSTPALPIRLPAAGPWQLQVLGLDGCFLYGLYRRRMQAIRYLGTLDRLVGAPVTTRNWNTITAVGRVLGSPVHARSRRPTSSRR